MTAKKKTNYISYELERLDKYFKQLENYLEKNPPDKMQDRIEIFEGARGPIAKVVATKESQINCWTDKFQKLPGILLQINALRKEVDGQGKEIVVRGQQEVPGFMEQPDEPIKQEEPEEIPSIRKFLPQNEEHKIEFDDDRFWQEDD